MSDEFVPEDIFHLQSKLLDELIENVDRTVEVDVISDYQLVINRAGHKRASVHVSLDSNDETVYIMNVPSSAFGLRCISYDQLLDRLYNFPCHIKTLNIR